MIAVNSLGGVYVRFLSRKDRRYEEQEEKILLAPHRRLLELLLKILAIMPRVRLPHSPREKKHMPLEKAANSFIDSNSYTLKTTF